MSLTETPRPCRSLTQVPCKLGRIFSPSYHRWALKALLRAGRLAVTSSGGGNSVGMMLRFETRLRGRPPTDQPAASCSLREGLPPTATPGRHICGLVESVLQKWLPSFLLIWPSQRLGAEGSRLCDLCGYAGPKDRTAHKRECAGNQGEWIHGPLGITWKEGRLQFATLCRPSGSDAVPSRDCLLARTRWSACNAHLETCTYLGIEEYEVSLGRFISNAA